MGDPNMTIQPTWRKASFSHDNGCVELARVPGGVGVRDSKHGDASAVLAFTRSEMRAFIDGVKAGEFDDLT
jgi:hypothetical protein